MDTGDTGEWILGTLGRGYRGHWGVDTKDTGAWILGTLGSGYWGHWGVDTGDTGEWILGTLGSGYWEHWGVDTGDTGERILGTLGSGYWGRRLGTIDARAMSMCLATYAKGREKESGGTGSHAPQANIISGLAR